jgi:mono/diheme cytochrome c family protein
MPESGQKLYERSCASCHGKGARGDGPAAASLRTPPPDLTQIAKRRNGQFPAGDIATYIDGRLEVPAHGSREMPIWGDSFSDSVGGGTIGDEVTRGNVAVIVEYLKSIQR